MCRVGLPDEKWAPVDPEPRGGGIKELKFTRRTKSVQYIESMGSIFSLKISFLSIKSRNLSRTSIKKIGFSMHETNNVIDIVNIQ
jgi:hypothetical protein